MLYRRFKRLIDLLFSISFLVFFLPFLAFLALLIRLDSPGPVFYRHKRIGKAGIPFDLIKLRTMEADSDDSDYLRYLKALIESERNGNGNGNGMAYRKMSSDGRITHVGKVLRKYYLDELPQMLNVLKGEMSLVGPRPHVQFEVDYYTPEQRRRLSVPPGATGLWQVAGKGDSTFNELIELDLEYVDHWNLKLDFQILIQTIFLMLQGGEGSWTRADKSISWKKRIHSSIELAAVNNNNNYERIPAQHQSTR